MITDAEKSAIARLMKALAGVRLHGLIRTSNLLHAPDKRCEHEHALIAELDAAADGALPRALLNLERCSGRRDRYATS